MPFDLSGNFSRSYNYTQDRDNGIHILASRIDGEFDNFATAMNSVFFRTGIVPMSGALDMGLNRVQNLADGSQGSPALRFGTDTTSGIFLDSAGHVSIGTGSTKRFTVSSTGIDVVGGVAASAASTFGNTLTISAGGLVVTGNATLNNNLGVGGNLAVTGTTALTGALTSAAAITISAGGLVVTGNSTFNNNLGVGGTLGVTGALTAGGGLATTSFSTTGNAAIGGTLTSTGVITAQSWGNFNQGITLTANNQPFNFTDASGSNPKLVCQNDNNLVIYSTDAAGNPRAAISISARSSTSSLVLSPNVQMNGNLTLSGTASLAALTLGSALGVAYGGTGTTSNTGTGDVVLRNDPALLGNPTAPTQAYGNASTRLATTAFVDKLLDLPRVTGGLQRGAVFATAAGFTVNAANAGETYMAYNDSAAAVTVTQGTATLRLHGTTTTGNRTLAARGFATIWFNAAGEAIIMGDVS